MLVGYQRPKQDDDAKAPEAAAGDLTEFRHGEAVLCGPKAEDAGANSEADACGENCEKARPKESVGVG